jgi:hypothetical protein
MKPFYQNIAKLNNNQKPFLPREVAFSVNSQRWTRRAYNVRQLIITIGYSFLTLPTDQERWGFSKLIEPIIDFSKNELEENLALYYSSFAKDDGNIAVNNGLYYSHELDYVARFITHDRVVEVDYKALVSLRMYSSAVKIAEPYITEDGLAFKHQGRIVGTITSQPYPYVDPLSYHKMQPPYTQFRYTVLEDGTQVRGGT